MDNSTKEITTCSELQWIKWLNNLLWYHNITAAKENDMSFQHLLLVHAHNLLYSFSSSTKTIMFFFIFSILIYEYDHFLKNLCNLICARYNFHFSTYIYFKHSHHINILGQLIHLYFYWFNTIFTEIYFNNKRLILTKMRAQCNLSLSWILLLQ